MARQIIPKLSWREIAAMVLGGCFFVLGLLGEARLFFSGFWKVDSVSFFLSLILIGICLWGMLSAVKLAEG